MNKKGIIGGIVGGILIPSVVYAHITGAFGQYLVSNERQVTNQKALQQEINQTKKEIEDLTPTVNQLTKTYEKKEKTAQKKLLFYQNMGLDTLYQMMTEKQDLMTFLSAQYLAKKDIESYMNQLNDLYVSYQQAMTTQHVLKGHEALLKMIEENVRAKDTLMKKYRLTNTSPDYQAKAIGIVLDSLWKRELTQLDEHMMDDFRTLASKQSNAYTILNNGNTLVLNEKEWNKQMHLRYFIRADHLYIYEKGKESNVILIATIKKNTVQTNTFYLEMEAGFLNGFPLPPAMLKDLQVFLFDFSDVSPNHSYISVEQTDQTLYFKTRGQLSE